MKLKEDGRQFPAPKSPKDVCNDSGKARPKAKKFMKMGGKESLSGLGNLGERKIFTLVSERDGNGQRRGKRAKICLFIMIHMKSPWLSDQRFFAINGHDRSRRSTVGMKGLFKILNQWQQSREAKASHASGKGRAITHIKCAVTVKTCCFQD